MQRNNKYLPPTDVRRKKLEVYRFLWLLVPIVGIIGYVEISRELTDVYGYPNWYE